MWSARRLVQALSALLCAGALAACGATIPESGPVVVGAAVGAGSDNQFIRVIARPPLPGAAPIEIVRGFLEASASFQDGYSVARQFLTAEAAQIWNPAISTRVYDGAGVQFVADGSNRVTMEAPLVGRIDDQGSYAVAEPGSTDKSTFTLTRDDGQWRISVPPTGLLLSRGDVERGFRTYSVYFLDPAFTTLVPDPITVPSSGSSAATTLVRRLVEGPTDWLAPAVRTAFPNGTSLAIDSVPIDNGIAQVSLDPRALSADDSTRAAMSAQIVWTLRQVPEVTGVRITAGGAPFVVPGQTSVQSRDAWPTYDPDAFPPDASGYALTTSGVVRLGDVFAVQVPGAAGDPKPPIASVTVSRDSQWVAGLNGERTTLLESQLTDRGVFRERTTGTAMSSLGYGPDGSLWWVEPTGIRTLDRQSSEPITVGVESIEGARVVSLSLARDGTRAALLLRRGPRTELVLVRVERRDDSVRLSGPRRIEGRISSAVDVAWASSNRLLVLGSDGAGPLQLFFVGTGSEAVRADEAPPKSVSLAAAPSRDVLVGSTDGGVYGFDAFQWRRLVTGSSPTYPS